MNYPRGQAGYFHAKQTVDISPPNTPYSTVLAQEGHGKVVGTFFDSYGFVCDGDEFTFIDDSKAPQIHGSGTEDDHNQGWGGIPYQKPLWGGMVDGVQAAYRYYMNDSYLFNKSIRITFEHSDAGLRHGQKTDAVAFFYQAPEGICNLKLTDELDVGNGAAEKAHAYSITGQTWSGVVGCCYDVYEQDRKYNHVRDDGRAFKGASEFPVKIDPNNQGVLLRRRCNRHLAQHQVAEVYVDGVKASAFPWNVCEPAAPAHTGWTDSDYFIPAALTAGKKQITIKVQICGFEQRQAGHQRILLLGLLLRAMRGQAVGAVGRVCAVGLNLMSDDLVPHAKNPGHFQRAPARIDLDPCDKTMRIDRAAGHADQRSGMGEMRLEQDGIFG